MSRRFLQGLAPTFGSGTASRPPAMVTGQQHWRTDKNFMETYDGTAWRVAPGSVGEAADISNPYDGQLLIIPSAGYRPWRYNATTSAWYQVLGRINSVTSGTSGFNLTTTGQVIASMTVTLASGVLVRAGVTFVANANTAGTNGFFQIRQKIGTTVDTSGTVIPQAKAAPNLSRGAAGDNQTVSLIGEFTPGSNSQYVIAWTGNVGSGTGVVAADSANHGWTFWIDAIGS